MATNIKYASVLFPIVMGVMIIQVLSGCATTPKIPPLTPQELSSIRQDHITILVHQTPPPFRHGTSNSDGFGMTFGVIGSSVAEAMAKRSGETIRKNASIENPILRVKNKVVAALLAEGKIASPATDEIIDSNLKGDPASLGLSVLALEFRTAHWGIGALSKLFGANLYTVSYTAEAGLIRLQDKKILWTGRCNAFTPEDKKATLEELQKNGGALLREEMAEVADRCADSLWRQFPSDG